MPGSLFQWPPLVILIMFPILVAMYVKSARREEREAPAEFGEKCKRYMASTLSFYLAWIPLAGRKQRKYGLRSGR